ncbi:hypothetical protein SAMN05421830_108138 [Desulfomicrobium norvegicum]|uniref:Uncharacterized protein n=1 Tax=Desulfomicrobium norvegicum (strain DSM 1741 / NCIMB 8310) TaxID=52561 RepID=A0A8G2C401_DESNO|nr:hypothetical protein [Desulfomicrobium norvegicum]SFL89070.1 hypothetical protein SAMN05421830_108138 [Desulfomicrobium norvegicum]
MLLIPISHTIHYKAAFDINNSKGNALTSVRNEIKNWLKNHDATKNQKHKLDQSWFDLGDTEQYKIGEGYIRTAINKGEYRQTNPKTWAIEFLHKDFKEMCRLWSTEIALTQLENKKLRFACTLKHAIFENWVGFIPSEPFFSVPKFIKDIIAKYECYKEETTIQKTINQCIEVDINSIQSEIINKKRVLPIIIAAENESNKNSIDVETLQKITIGNANIYLIKSNKISDFNSIFPYELSIQPGMIRIFFKFDNTPSNAKIHRFYTENKIQEIGQQCVFDQIGIAISRNSKSFTASEIITIKDVINARARDYLTHLKHENKNTTSATSTYVQLLEEVNTNLEHKIKDQEKFIDEVIEQNNIFDEEISKLKSKNYHLTTTKQESLPKLILPIIPELPDDITTCLVYFSEMFPDKIIIHQNAFESAKNFSGNDNIYSVKSAWRILNQISTTLHNIIFSDDKDCDVEKEFCDSTGIRLSLREGKQTNKDKSIMKKRECEYNGINYTCTPHIKTNKREGYLRIHIAFLHEEKKILIGHCGEHLETYGTQKIC